MVEAMSRIPKVKCIRPDGAFYLFCDFTKIGPSEELAKRILDEVKVAVIPGDSFGAPGFLRLSFATSQERIQEGTRRIAEWVREFLNVAGR
jgi:aspartate aminotransferase